MGWPSKEEIIYKQICWNPDSLKGGISGSIETTCTFEGCSSKEGGMSKKEILFEAEK